MSGTRLDTGPLRSRGLVLPILVLLAALPLHALVAGLVAGPVAAAAAAAGLALTAMFFLSSAAVVTTVDRYLPRMTLPAALGFYVLKITVLGALLLLPSTPTTRAMAWSVVAGAVEWQIGYAVGVQRARILYVQPAAGEPPATPGRERAL